MQSSLNLLSNAVCRCLRITLLWHLLWLSIISCPSSVNPAYLESEVPVEVFELNSRPIYLNTYLSHPQPLSFTPLTLVFALFGGLALHSNFIFKPSRMSRASLSHVSFSDLIWFAFRIRAYRPFPSFVTTPWIITSFSTTLTPVSCLSAVLYSIYSSFFFSFFLYIFINVPSSESVDLWFLNGTGFLFFKLFIILISYCWGDGHSSNHVTLSLIRSTAVNFPLSPDQRVWRLRCCSWIVCSFSDSSSLPVFMRSAFDDIPYHLFGSRSSQSQKTKGGGDKREREPSKPSVSLCGKMRTYCTCLSWSVFLNLSN